MTVRTVPLAGGGLHVNSKRTVWEHPFIEDGKFSKLWGGLKVCVHWLAIALAIASVGFFVCGTYSVREAVTNLAKAAS
jgi:hypothetical protein